MPITVACPSCRKALKAPDNAAGRKVKCPGCGSALIIPAPQMPAAPFEDLPVPTPATPTTRAKTPNRIILFAAIGGGVLVALVLIAVVIALIKGNTYPPSEVHVKVAWKTPAGIKPDLNPAAVFIPKGSREKINAVVPIAAGRKEHFPRGIILKLNPYVVPVEEVGAADIGYQARFDLLSYQDRFGPEYKRSKAYFSALSMNGDLMLDVPEGEYTLIVFGNGPEEDKGVVIPPAEASKDEATLREFFAPDAIVGQLLGGTKVHVREVQVKRGRVEFKCEFDMPHAQAAAKPPQEKREEVKIAPEKNADQVKEPEQVKGPPGEQQREKLLAELEAKKRDALPALQEEHRRLEAALEQLRKEEAALRRNPRFGDPFNKQIVSQFNDLLKKQRALATRIQKSREALDQKVSDFEQERRKILVQFPAPADSKFVEHKGLLYTQEELDRLKAYEEEHAKPRKVAASYMRTLIAKGLVGRPASFAGFYKNPKGNDSYAIAYKVASVNDKKVLGDTVHLYVFKDKQGYWQVSAFSQDGVHVMLGPPPRGFQPAPDPGKEE